MFTTQQYADDADFTETDYADLKCADEDEVDRSIITERNRDIKAIEEDMGHLADITRNCAELVHDQGYEVDAAETNISNSLINIEETVETLEQISATVEKKRGFAFNAYVLLTGVGIGSLGWIGGPWIGIPTTLAGIGVSSTIIFIKKKIGI